MTLLTRIQAGTIVARSVLAWERPDRLPRALAAMKPWGTSIAGLIAGGAARHPDRPAVVDPDGEVTYAELWRRARALSVALAGRGVGPGTRVGLVARDHAGFVVAASGVAITGADLVLLNTGFAGPQVADVVTSEAIDVVIHDDEFASVVAHCGADTVDAAGLAAMTAGDPDVVPPPAEGRVVILTSGTTGRPKGAARSSSAAGPEAVAALLDRIPLRAGDTQVIAAPLFHAWGLSHLLLGLARCATTIVTGRFDPDRVLAAAARHRADVLVVVPVMLSRILALPADVLAAHPTPDLRVIASSGSAIGGSVVARTLDHFGPVLHNLYGSTEVAVATIADPDDLRAEPSTSGRVARGVRVEILDEADDALPEGKVGRIFVGGAMRFDGYTNGDDKQRVRGLVSSGDVGYFRDGLLFVEGRDDDMIVSGGENVFPREVEELLQAHPAIAEAAVTGVPDDEFGQALHAIVARVEGSELDEAAVRAHVRDHLARHKVPRQVTFVDALPRNATGKLLRREL